MALAPGTLQRTETAASLPNTIGISALGSSSPTQQEVYAAGAAYLAQQAQVQALASRQPQRVRIDALLPSETWPDTDDEHLYIAALDGCEDQPTPDADFVWGLYDSGSGLTTCPKDMLEDIELVPSSRQLSAEAATGDSVKSFGKRSVLLDTEWRGA